MKVKNPLATLPIELAHSVPLTLSFYEFYRHKKSGNLYRFVKLVPNYTNTQDGQVMVEYVNVAGMPGVREVNEFLVKFEPHIMFERPETSGIEQDQLGR